MSENGKPPDPVGGVVKGLVGLFAVLLPIAGVMYAYFETEARHAERVDAVREDFRLRHDLLRDSFAKNRIDLGLVRSDLVHHAAEQARTIEELRAALDTLRGRVDTHSKLGVGSLPHPAGVVAELKDVERKVAVLEAATDDRWRSKDMRAWVKLLAAQNEALDVPNVENGHR